MVIFCSRSPTSRSCKLHCYRVDVARVRTGLLDRGALDARLAHHKRQGLSRHHCADLARHPVCALAWRRYLSITNIRFRFDEIVCIPSDTFIPRIAWVGVEVITEHACLGMLAGGQEGSGRILLTRTHGLARRAGRTGCASRTQRRTRGQP